MNQSYFDANSSTFQDNLHLTPIYLLLPLSQTLLLTLGFDRTFCIFELHALGRFTDRVFTLHTLGQTLTTSHHLTPYSLILPQSEGSLQKLLLWKDYTQPMASVADDEEGSGVTTN